MSDLAKSPAAALIDRLPPQLLAVAAIVLIQLGAGLARDIIGSADAMALLFVRLAAGSVLMLPWIAPTLARLTRRQWADAAALGAVYALFNVSAYWALERLPLGLVATIGFLGPLCVSLIGIGAAREFAWPLLGLCGVLLLAPLGEASSQSFEAIAYGLFYALMWALYILVSTQVGRNLPGLSGFATATFLAGLMIAPFGAPASLGLFPGVGAIAMVGAVVVLSTFPFALEFEALKRLPPRTFGVLLSLEPGIAAATGLALLGEALDARDLLALCLVSAAALGATMTMRKNGDPQ